MDLYADRCFAEMVAKRIGVMIRKAGPQQTRPKGDGTPQSCLDVDGNSLFHILVAEKRPDDFALGEEDVDGRRKFPDGARVWVCDPVDGTWLLPLGLPYTVVSVALVVGGIPVVGVVYDPHTDRLFTAARGAGAHLVDHRGVERRLAVDSNAELAGSVVVMPCGMVGGGVAGLDVAQLHRAAIDAGADLITVGSAVHDATLVATGFAAGMVYPYVSPWDMAAINVIVTEAGGDMTDIDGAYQLYDRAINGAIVAANPAVRGQLVRLVRTYRR